LEKAFSKSHKKNKLIKTAFDQINGKDAIPLVFVQGDFAPWNIKQNKEQELIVIDWEFANSQGLPLWDLCHFFLIQAHLFDLKNPIQDLIQEPLIDKYLAGLNICPSDKKDLILLYFLDILFIDKNHDKLYKNFLYHHLTKHLI